MRKDYIRPESVILLLRGEQPLLTGSLLLIDSLYNDTPVPDAVEGETVSWGDWSL